MPTRTHFPSRRTAPRRAGARLPRAGLLVGLLGAVALGSACHSFRPAPTPLPPGDARVRVRFGEPRDLVAVGGEGDTVAWPSVVALEGRARHAGGDTLLLQVESSQREGERSVRWDRWVPTVAVLPAAGARVESRQFDGGKTTLAVLGTAAASRRPGSSRG